MRDKPLIAGNWKMNGLSAELAEISAAAAAVPPGVDVLICPPATLLREASRLASASIATGGQDCHPAASGANTGDLSAAMLADAGATHVIVGHSERRADHREDDGAVRAKADAARGAGLVAIVCIGETEAERERGETLAVLERQLAGSLGAAITAADTVLAYEPVWAIGTGRTPTSAEIAATHAFLREALVRRYGAATGASLRILYGGSVKPANAGEILSLPNVDGALVGGASLKAADLLAICRAALRPDGRRSARPLE